MIGLGAVGQRHLRNLSKLLGDDLQVSAYRVRRLPRVVTESLQIEPHVNVEQQYQIKAFEDLDRALDDKPNLALICNPSSLHMSVALRVARAACNLFLQKPRPHNFDGVEELIGEVEKRRLVGLVGYQLRYHPCIKRLKVLVRDGAVGRVIAVRMEAGEYLPDWHTYEDYRQTYAARRELGGGVVLTQIHDMDLVYSLFGLPERLFALGGRLTRLEIDVEDTASILMQCRIDGQILPIHLQQDYIQRPPSRRYEFIGDSGKIQVDLRAPSLTAYDRNGQLLEQTVFTDFKRNQLFLDQTAHLLACCRGEQAPNVPIRDGAQSLRMALAAKESMATGRLVDLSAPPGEQSKSALPREEPTDGSLVLVEK